MLLQVEQVRDATGLLFDGIEGGAGGFGGGFARWYGKAWHDDLLLLRSRYWLGWQYRRAIHEQRESVNIKNLIPKIWKDKWIVSKQWPCW